MERRVLVAVFLSFLVLYLYQAFLVPPQPPAEEPAAGLPAVGAGTEASGGGAVQSLGGGESGQPAAAPSAVSVAPALPAPEALVSESSERDIRVETADLVAVFTNRGGRLKSWRLKRYLDDRGESLELVPDRLTEQQPLPFSLRVTDEAMTRRLNDALYSVGGAPADGVLTAPATLTFEYQDAAGLHATKEFRFEPASYRIGLRVSVAENASPLTPAIEWGPALASSASVGATYGMRMSGGLLFTGELERLAAGDIAGDPLREGTFRYAGVEDHYFISVAVNPGQAKVTFQPVALPPPPGTDETAVNLVSWAIEPAAAGSPVTFFAGPKDFDLLAAADPELVRAIDFGMFSFLVVPLLRSLNWINAHVGNYGFSIVILTILINAAMFPLRHKSVVSMRKMQEIQPEAKAIQERYAKLKATDPAKQKMNQELMALYRERGVNPASGCVPMLLTLPVLLAFYSLLTVSIELRGAPFFGWIRDLSQPDPFYVTPVLMGATQFWQMRLTPQTGVDPAQQKMMQFMPLLFMFFFLWAPAGVVLYWFVSNVWAIGQQYATNYIIGPPNVRTVRPPAERRVKRVGGGRTDEAARETGKGK
jgi:YidC/Oxa1 family membrane protein insertase